MTPREEAAASMRLSMDELAAGVPVLAATQAAPNLRTLDWSPNHDERSRAYALADRLRHRVALQDHVWPTGPVLDQGRDGACVGFAGIAAGNVLTAMSGKDPAALALGWDGAADAQSLYQRAQELDDISGEDYVGTSVLAGMKAGVERELWAGYGWCFGTRDIAQALLQVGPVVVGIPVTASMATTAPNGRVLVTGPTLSGHCLTVVGLRMELESPVTYADPPGPFFVVQNSWGASWGDRGFGYVHHADLARLLAQQGEAAIPLATGWEPAP